MLHRERMMAREKVFCIGFHKTGTSTLAEALRHLGYRVTGPNGVRDPDIEHSMLPMARQLVTRFDAFQDNPWPILYREMDDENPDSKFILTIRSSESWINSQVKHFGYHETPMRRWIYGQGCPQGNESLYMDRYERHNREVREYFKGRPDDLLVLRLANGDGWSKLCPFLGMDIPDIAFPHENKASDREKKMNVFVRSKEAAKSITRRCSRRLTRWRG